VQHLHLKGDAVAANPGKRNTVVGVTVGTTVHTVLWRGDSDFDLLISLKVPRLVNVDVFPEVSVTAASTWVTVTTFVVAVVHHVSVVDSDNVPVTAGTVLDGPEAETVDTGLFDEEVVAFDFEVGAGSINVSPVKIHGTPSGVHVSLGSANPDDLGHVPLGEEVLVELVGVDGGGGNPGLCGVDLVVVIARRRRKLVVGTSVHFANLGVNPLSEGIDAVRELGEFVVVV